MINYGLKNAKIYDEVYTPEYAVIPLIKYIEEYKEKNIILPFDTEESAFYKVLKSNGFKNVTANHIINGKDFFLDMYDEYDLIISNPPFSIKDKVIERLYLLNKPFAMLLPLTTLSSQKRVNIFKKHGGVDLLVFDKRINYIVNGEQKNGNWFASAYFTKYILNQMIVFENL